MRVKFNSDGKTADEEAGNGGCLPIGPFSGGLIPASRDLKSLGRSIPVRAARNCPVGGSCRR